LAEEAIGLAKSIKWDIVQGPMWNEEGKTLKVDDDFSEPENNQEYVPVENIKGGSYIYTDLVEGVFVSGGIAYSPYD